MPKKESKLVNKILKGTGYFMAGVLSGILFWSGAYVGTSINNYVYNKKYDSMFFKQKTEFLQEFDINLKGNLDLMTEKGNLIDFAYVTHKEKVEKDFELNAMRIVPMSSTDRWLMDWKSVSDDVHNSLRSDWGAVARIKEKKIRR